MGPSTSVDGEERVEFIIGMGYTPLQWGRRQASTERLGRASEPDRNPAASMGPSTSVDGEFAG